MTSRVIMDAQMGRFGSIKEATGVYLSDLSLLIQRQHLTPTLILTRKQRRWK